MGVQNKAIIWWKTWQTQSTISGKRIWTKTKNWFQQNFYASDSMEHGEIDSGVCGSQKVRVIGCKHFISKQWSKGGCFHGATWKLPHPRVGIECVQAS